MLTTLTSSKIPLSEEGEKGTIVEKAMKNLIDWKHRNQGWYTDYNF